VKYLVMLIFLSVIAATVATLAQEPDPILPVETCGTDVPKVEAELRAVSCPEGFEGQWFQERPANSCDWQPRLPQWFACSRIIDMPTDESVPIDP
jgi:hypothetical protein